MERKEVLGCEGKMMGLVCHFALFSLSDQWLQ